jgi:ligand-binding sensor domain-containing protein
MHFKFPMRYFFLVSALFLITSCSEQAATHISQIHINEQQPFSALSSAPYKPSGNLTVDDPTFIRSTDTVSMYGPHSITRNVLQDKSGNLWFATWQGIIRYDGKVFTNLTLKEGLKHFHVFSVYEDKARNLWFGMIGGGLYRYELSTKAFTYFTSKDGLAGNSVFCMLEDKTGNMWFGTNGGVSYYNGRSFSSFTRKDGLLQDSVYAMAEDNNGKLWLGTEGGVNSCYATSASLIRFTKEKDLFFRHVMAITKDNDGKLWIGSQAGLHRYDPRVGEKSLTAISTSFVSMVHEDKAGRIWFGGDVYCYDPSGKKALTHFAIKEGQNSNNLFCIYEDNSGNFWFGSTNGVRRYEGKPLPDGRGNFTEFRKIQ